MKAANNITTIIMQATGQTRKMNQFVTMRQLTPAKRIIIDHLFAMLVFVQNLPFAIANNKYFANFISTLKTNWKAPNPQKIGRELLDDVYINIRKGVNKIVDNALQLNVSVDESTNIRLQRIIVLIITSATTSFFITSENVSAKSINAVNYVRWILERLHKITKENLKRINSISTDTCNTMRAT
jgi:hypothetical protein